MNINARAIENKALWCLRLSSRTWTLPAPWGCACKVQVDDGDIDADDADCDDDNDVDYSNCSLVLCTVPVVLA